MSAWPIVALEDVFAVARGGSPRPIDSFITDDPTGVNWIMIGDASEGSKYISSTKKRIIKEGVKKSRMVSAGDFLLTNSMSFGKPYILKTSGCIHDGWLVLSPRHDQIHSDFFYYLLGSDLLYSNFKKLAAGAVVKNLNSELVRGVQIPLPPLAEQKRIAAILDAADALRAKRREALAQLDALLQSSFLTLFGDPVTNPMGWEVAPMTSISEILTGFAFPSGKYLVNGDGIALCRGINVGLGSLSWDERVDWNSSYEAKLDRYELKRGDIILAMDRPWISGGLKAATVTESDLPSLLVQRVARIRANDLASQSLLYALIKHPVFERHCRPTETTIPHISPLELKSFPVILPPLPLQQKFATIVESVERQKAAQRAHLAELDALFAALQHRAFRGEL